MKEEPKKEIIYYTLRLAPSEAFDLRRNENKDYVAGYLIGRLVPVWKEEKTKEQS